MIAHADPARRVLTDKAIEGYAKHDEPHPTCRVCGHALRAGDFVDSFYPYDHSGNVHQRCVPVAPEPARSR